MPSLLITIIFLLFAVNTCCADKRALLIGIGNYDTETTGWRKIHGDKDVFLLQPLLQRQNFKVNALINENATKKNIVKMLTQLAHDSQTGDIVYLHFSGHGQPVIDCNGDEKKDYDEAIVPYDAYKSEGYAKLSSPYKGENHLIDDEINPLIQKIRTKIGKNGMLFIVFDACYSQGLEKGENPFSEDFDIDDLPKFMRGTAEFFNPSDKSYLKSLSTPIDFPSGCPTAIVTSCRANERNFEFKVGDKHYGSLSYCISKLLHNNTDFRQWIYYFQNHKYKSSGCFLKIQHPTITVYK